MTDWGSLRDASGSAAEVPHLLSRAESDDHIVWEDLWSRLYHQGTVHPASYVALERLTAMAARSTPTGHVEPLALATAILASTDGPDRPAAVRARDPLLTTTLNQVALANLSRAATSTEFVYGVQAVLATETDSIWTTRLGAIADEDLELECPCGEHLYLELGRLPASVRTWSAGHVATGVMPATDDSLVDAERRAHALALAHGRHDVARTMLILFGQVRCPARDRRATATYVLA